MDSSTLDAEEVAVAAVAATVLVDVSSKALGV